MTISPGRRPALPLVQPGLRHGNRSLMTCYYRCGNACDCPEPNTSGNPHVRTFIERAIARRRLLQLGAAGAGALVVGGAGSAPAAADPPRAAGSVATDDWDPVEPNVRDTVVVPAGFTATRVITWGDAVLPGAPAFDPHAQTPEGAARQFGYNCDYLGVLPLDHHRALLVANHEFTNEELMFPTGEYDRLAQMRIAIESHGMSVVTIQRSLGWHTGAWKALDPEAGKWNRRITGNTPFAVAGPAAGTPRMRTTADPEGRTALGTLNNCAGGVTPWGTVLSGEENFNQYFNSSTGALDPRYATTSYRRYGIPTAPPFGRPRTWWQVDPRFDLATDPHEPFRFGWIVEVDPYDPTSTPRKQTMLGRFKHEGANIMVADDGHVAAYMGDDERGEYLYKFVSAGTFDDSGTAGARRHNMGLLETGTLYVARITDEIDPGPVYDGAGTWVPLASDTESFVPGMSVADVLIDTRIAADAVGATRMDRPEDVEPNPVNGRIYACLTNNVRRGTVHPANAANPITTSMVRSQIGAPLTPAPGNNNGYVLELTEDGGDHAGTSFSWLLMLVCGDPEAPETYFAGFDKTMVSPISCPDNVAFDSVGNAWLATDGNVLGSNDGIFRVPVAGPDRGRVQQFLTVPVGAEACGPLVTDDRSVWVAVQHPGEVDGSTFEDPASTWPQDDGYQFPRPAVVVVHRR